jgi:hypothetical protein
MARIFLPSILVVALFLGAACASDSGGVADVADAGDGDGDGDAADAGEHESEARYVIATAVTDDSGGASTYVAVLDSLEADELDLSRASEFGGWSDMGVIGEWIFVSSGEAAEIERFTVNEDLLLEAAGAISFSNYTSDANFYAQELVSPTKAYLATGSEFVIWNPSTLEITGTLAFPDDVQPRDGIEPNLAVDRGAVVRGDRLYATLTWTDTENLNMLPDSRIVVVDVENDEVVDVLEVPCPDLNVADSDEEGNLYFSNWVYSPGATLLYGDEPACVVRIPAGSEQLDSFRYDYADATGHEGAVMSYLGDGKWLYSTFLGDPAEHDPDDDWFDWLFGDTWQLDVLDVDNGTTTKVSGIPQNGGGYYASRFDDVTHVLIPEESYTATSVYALDSNGKATRKLHTRGWSTRLFKLK